MAALWQWRDNTARNLDESIHYIMSNSELLRIGIIMPTTQSELNQCEPIMNDLVDKVIGKSTNSTNSTNSPNNIILEVVISSKMKVKSSSNVVINGQTSGSNLSQKLSTPYRKDIHNENVLSSPINENKLVSPLADRLLCGRALRTPSRY